MWVRRVTPYLFALGAATGKAKGVKARRTQDRHTHNMYMYDEVIGLHFDRAEPLPGFLISSFLLAFL